MLDTNSTAVSLCCCMCSFISTYFAHDTQYSYHLEYAWIGERNIRISRLELRSTVQDQRRASAGLHGLA